MYAIRSYYEGDILENPWAEAPEEMYVLTVRPEDAPDQPEYVEIEFSYNFV